MVGKGIPSDVQSHTKMQRQTPMELNHTNLVQMTLMRQYATNIVSTDFSGRGISKL